MTDMIDLNNKKITSTDNNEKENENNSKIITQIINLKLKIFFKYLISIFQKRESILKVQFFCYLKMNPYAIFFSFYFFHFLFH